MPTVNGTVRLIRRLIAIAGVSYCLCSFAEAQSNPIYLPDPTPRDRDLHDKYKDDPLRQVRQQQAALLRQAQLHQQAIEATNRLTQLAQQLKEEMEKGGKDSSSLNLNAQRAAEIEKLAKIVKNSMKSQ
jgi:hypothetical protein